MVRVVARSAREVAVVNEGASEEAEVQGEEEVVVDEHDMNWAGHHILVVAAPPLQDLGNQSNGSGSLGSSVPRRRE